MFNVVGKCIGDINDYGFGVVNIVCLFIYEDFYVDFWVFERNIGVECFDWLFVENFYLVIEFFFVNFDIIFDCDFFVRNVIVIEINDFIGEE